MASIEINSESKQFHIRFRYGKREFKRSLKTADEKEARAALARAEETLSLVHRGVLELPRDADPTVFFLSQGRTAKRNVSLSVSLKELFEKYERNLPTHAKEASTIETEQTHLRHFRKHFPTSRSASSITTHDVQLFVNKQLKRKVNGRFIKVETVKRQIDTLRGIFNWANRQELCERDSPTNGLVFPKRDEKPPFKTRDEIQRTLDRGGISETEERELWDCLYLTKEEVRKVLDFVQLRARYPFIYPMFAFVAYTGARRSEMMRAQIDDFDLDSGTVVVRERKRVRSRSTSFRHVQIPSFLVQVISAWFARHPGGQFAFCHDFGIVKRDTLVGLTRDQARIQFEKTIRRSEWNVIRGFHVFRHSYSSNLAACGVDQRIIDKHMGHQTEEMRRRYQHLRPDICKSAVEKLVS